MVGEDEIDRTRAILALWDEYQTATQSSSLSLLTRAGLALHGPQWQSPLARDLNLSPRMMRYYISGQRPIPPRILSALARLTFARADLLVNLSSELDSHWDASTHVNHPFNHLGWEIRRKNARRKLNICA
jgi:hypothetical protein